jgi:ribonuclease VapC
MVVDTSAIVAALVGEPEADRLRDRLKRAEECRISALTLLETRIVLLRRFDAAVTAEFENLVRRRPLQVAAFDDDQAALATDAYRRFGKGGGHPAQLNLADCAAYALARSLGMPLLYKGEDFARTDIEPALV